MASRSWLPVDVVLVGLFAAAGRLSHYDTVTLAGSWTTAWPFLMALGLGWLVLLLSHRQFHSVTSGAILWVITVLGGMLMRLASDQGTAWPFVVVATVTLGVLLIAPRAVMRLVRPVAR